MVKKICAKQIGRSEYPASIQVEAGLCEEPMHETMKSLIFVELGLQGLWNSQESQHKEDLIMNTPRDCFEPNLNISMKENLVYN